MWLDSWSDLGRILAVGASAYVSLVLVLRFSGKRTLAELNAFDLVVTVALGSTLATILLSSDVSWSEGRSHWCCWLCCSSSWPGPRSAGRPCGG